MRVRACVWGWLCKSGCRTQPVRIIAAKGFQDSSRHIPSGPQTSASASKYGTLSQKEKFLQCRMSAVVSSNSSKLCWPGPQEAAWTSLKMQALSENICAHLCLGSQWPLRNGILLREPWKTARPHCLQWRCLMSFIMLTGYLLIWIIIK